MSSVSVIPAGQAAYAAPSTEQRKVASASPFKVIRAERDALGDAGTLTPGGAGRVMSTVQLTRPASLTFPTTSVCFTASVWRPDWSAEKLFGELHPE
jgi:hypothetical protein